MEQYISQLQRMVTKENSRTEAQKKAKEARDLREKQSRLKHTLLTHGNVRLIRT